MIWIILAIIFFISTCFFVFTTINLYRKLNVAIKEIEKAWVLYESISEKIIWSQTLLHEIDKRGAFKSDDEIGWFFKNVQLIQDELNGFQFKPKVEEKSEKT